MQADYFDSSSSLASQPLPTPSDTPYQTPFRDASRRPSGPTKLSSYDNVTPPPLPPDDSFRDFKDTFAHEKRGSRDLTPSLHASLVARIHELGRKMESKDELIDQLESMHADEKWSNEALQDELKRKDRRISTLENEMKKLEQSFDAVFDQLVAEKNAATDAATEARKKADTAIKDLKAEKEYTQQLHNETDATLAKSSQEKNGLLRKVELAESRLRSVLNEVTMQHVNNVFTPAQDDDADKENIAPLGEGVQSMHSSPTKPRKHRRNRSSLSSIGSVRQSTNPNGISLADELDLDSADEVPSEGELSDHEARIRSAQTSQRSSVRDPKARKVLGLVNGLPEQHTAGTTPAETLQKMQTASGLGGPLDMSTNTFAASQRLVQAVSGQEERGRQAPDIESVEANQRKKRDPLVRSPHSRVRSEPLQKFKPSQVYGTDGFQSPPGSAQSVKPFVTAVGAEMQEPEVKPEMVSTSTQTDVHEETRRSLVTPPSGAPAVEVPSIAIHPPDSSGPSSPGEAVLPPRTRSAGCQTELDTPTLTHDRGVQTGMIRMDMRKFLPPTVKEPVVVAPTRIADGASLMNLPPSPEDQSSLRSTSRSRATRSDDIPTEAAESTWSRLRKTMISNNKTTRPIESDPFSGQEDAAFSEADFSGPAPIMRSKRSVKYTRPSFDPPTPVPEDEKVAPRPSITGPLPFNGSRASFERQKIAGKTHSFAIAARGKPGQRAFVNPTQRPGSPSSVASSSAWSRNSGPQPPIAIPMRTSSAGLGRKSRGSGQSSPTRRSGASSPTKRFESARIGKKPLLRKAKSSAVAPSDAASESLPRSPFSRTSFASAEMTPSPVPGSASLPPVTEGHHRSSSSQTRRMSSFQPTGDASLKSNVQHSVAHALKETMIGEWMWKYTRKRKSFGVTDASGDKGLVRHKRWMWISPDERTVMWSSKQPRTETAWLGKSGRKLPITQVLDVKDDVTYVGNRNVFNRAILIITPARNLKFTAVTAERHFLWLTALSFLAAHTSSNSLDLSYLNRRSQEPVILDQPATRNTSGSASRSSRKPWSSKNRSRQSSGYATPSIPEASASVEGSSLAMAPRPNRPPPAAPLEHYLPDTALAPSIPRVPGNHSSSRINLHGRKRSASTTGVISSRGSSKGNNSGAASLRNFPTVFTANSSSRNLASSAPSSAIGPARPPLPSVPSSRAGNHAIAARHFGSDGVPPGSAKEPSTPVRDDDDPNNRFAEFAEGFEDALGGNGMGAAGLPPLTEFGTNSSFFGASANRKYHSRRSGQIFEEPPTREMMEAAANGHSGVQNGKMTSGGGLSSHPVPMEEDCDGYELGTADEVDAMQTDGDGQGHANTASVDSVAPPPIATRRTGQTNESEREPVQNGVKASVVSGRRKWF